MREKVVGARLSHLISFVVAIQIAVADEEVGLIVGCYKNSVGAVVGLRIRSVLVDD